MKRLSAAFIVLLWTAAAFAAEKGKLKVLTSFLPVYCLTVNVAGDAADVQVLISERASPHDFQFSPGDTRKVNEASVIVLNGLGVDVETKLERSLKASGKAQPRIIMSAGLQNELIQSEEHKGHHHHGTENPHVWLDPLLAMHCVSNILKGLQTADPANASTYQSNAQKYLSRLQGLHSEIASGLAVANRAPIVTYHDAFAYFARCYNLRVVGVVEEVADVPPGPRHLAKLRRTIETERVPVIFAEANQSSKLVRQIGRDLKVPVAVLDTLENGVPAAETYEDRMRANLKTIQKELQGYAPAGTR